MNNAADSNWLHNLSPFSDGHDPLVGTVLLLLILLSILTWFLIFYKAYELWRSNKANTKYENEFWDAPNAAEYLINTRSDAPLARLADNGVNALRHYHSHLSSSASAMGSNLTDILTRALRQAIQNQTTHFESGLGVLATIGNTAPFIGLFGTVVGMMTTLKSITASGTTDLNVVAGPIGAALIATAAGIACAVPAVVAYNSFLRRLRVLNNTLDSFAYDLLAHLASEDAIKRAGVHHGEHH